MSDRQDEAKSSGPIESRTWPKELTAHAVDDGSARRLHGYDVEQDLARFYRFSDVLYLSLAGDLPDDVQSRAFEVALTFASVMSVGSAPVHASVLARLCGCRTGGVVAVGALTMGEHVDALVHGIGEILEGTGPLPEELRAKTNEERASVARLAAATAGLPIPALGWDPSLDVALVAVLRAAGLTSVFQVVSALTLGKMPSALAEAQTTKPADFLSYPMDTPHFEYVPPGK
ncbi:hypothetical protein AKJ09_02590 [Labilithrix luteola]|uniref:Citrate synthase (Si) n=1 Tax=Labilithrix luteola TaxID=1391654 RepID=A0A0K1PRC3_9BACT|nr:hypothetical protein [Labilithrix luteola]AKU95926.1 hypothetical protein AKJ09_02590 [Labilithrix luteola]